MATLCAVFLGLNGCAPSLLTAQNGLQFAHLGDFALENGQVITRYTLAYRVFGQLNPERSNAVLFPTWYGGTTAHLVDFLGPEGMLDTSRYFVILVDAFGDGVSSSPSNSDTQSGKAFPVFSIKDLVHAQHQLVTQSLDIQHLFAVTGISMGALQTYQWMASYPDFFDRAIPIVGTPAMSSQDLLLFELFDRIMASCDRPDCPDLTANALLLEHLLAFTPDFRVRETSPSQVPVLMHAIAEDAKGYHLHDLHSQIRAMRTYDIAKACGGNPECVFRRFSGEILIIVSGTDTMLLPHPSQELNPTPNLTLLVLDSLCGHFAFVCEKEEISKAVREFLAR